jgi:hypothetical protein
VDGELGGRGDGDLACEGRLKSRAGAKLSVLRFKYGDRMSRSAYIFQSLETLREGKPTRRAGELVFPKFSVLRFKYRDRVSRSACFLPVR